MADETTTAVQDQQPDAVTATPVEAPQAPTQTDDLSDLTPVEGSEKVLPGQHPDAALSDLTPVSGSEKQLAPAQPKTEVKASGVVTPTTMRARPRSSPGEVFGALMNPNAPVDTEGFKNWLQDVQGDVRNGTSSTWVGSMLKFLGAKGTSYGTPEAVGDLMAGPLAGVPKALEGAIDVGQAAKPVISDLMAGDSAIAAAAKHPLDVQKGVVGANKVIGGVMQSVGPAGMLIAPEGEALPVVANSIVAQHVAEATATAMGADPDTAELVGNVAALGGGVLSVKAMHPLTERFGVAVNARTAAEQDYLTRSRFLETARGQAAEMQQRAVETAQREAQGKATPEETDAARTAAQDAAANVGTAQQAFDQAAERRAQAAVAVEKLHRQIMSKAAKADTERTENIKSGSQKNMELIKKAVPAKGTDFYEVDPKTGVAPKYDIVRAHLDAAKEAGVPVDNIKEARDAAESQRQGIEDKVLENTEKYANEPLTDSPEKSVKNVVTQKLDELAKEDGNFQGAADHLSDFNLTDLTTGDAKELLTKVNNYLRQMKASSNNWDIYNQIETNPKFAAYWFLADAVRDELYDKFESHDIKGIREARNETSALIDFRNMADAQLRTNRGATRVRGSGTQSRVRRLIGKLTGKAIKGAGIAVGAEMGGPVGAVGGGAVGEMVGEPVENFIAPTDLTRDEHIAKSMKSRGTTRRPVEIRGEGTPAVEPPVTPVPPAPKDSPEALQLTPRENTDLHADLASHYGITDLENTSYRELEQDLRDDVETKKNLGMAPDPKEQALLNKVLRADAADRGIRQTANKPNPVMSDEIKAELLKQAQKKQEGKEVPELNNKLVQKGIGEDSMLVSHSPAMKATAEPLPISGLREGMTSEDAHLHEWAHAAIGAVDGLEPVEIRTDLHPKTQKGEGAVTVFNGASFRDAQGNVDPELLGQQEVQWLTQKLAGPASHEVFKGIPREDIEKSIIASADFREARSIVREVHPDFTSKQVNEAVNAAYDRARDFLTKPHIADRVRANAAVREEGLAQTLHASHGRVNKFAEDIRNAHTEYTGSDAGPDGGGAGEGGEKAEKPAAEGEEKNAGRDKGGKREVAPKPSDKSASARGVAESKVSKPAVPKERSTGVPEVDEAIREGGAIPGGTQPGFEYKDKTTGETKTFPDLALFHDEESGTTLAHPRDQVTPEVVANKLRESRAQYAAVRPEESAVTKEKSLAEKAADHYGITDEPKKAGFILPDGRGLDFSDGQAAKTLDHGDVASILPRKGDDAVPYNADPRFHFVDKTKSARLLVSRDGVNVQLPSSGATRQQIEFITRAVEENPGKALNVDVQGADENQRMGYATHTPEDREGVERVIRDAKADFNKRNAALANIEQSKVVKDIAQGADDYNKEEGREPVDATPKPHNPEFAKRVADAFDAMKHEPTNPEVQKAYGAMADEVKKQWDYATDKMGVKFEPWTKEGQPYANSKEMVKDVADNKHLYFFQGGDVKAESPMAQVDPKTGLTYNDMFRAVHDLFGHAATGFEFGPKGEENAYLAHRQMFPQDAIPALTSETRGQNSWVNFGKHLRDESGNVPKKGEVGYVSPTERPYAEQKVGLLPEEFQGTGEGLKPEELEQSKVTKSMPEGTKLDDEWEQFGPKIRKLSARDADGNDIGHITIERPNKSTAFIAQSMVDESQRGKGIGENLYRAAIEDARKSGATELQSDTKSRGVSDDAQRVWQKLAASGDYDITQDKNGRWSVDLTTPNIEESKVTKSPKGSSVPLMQNPLPVKGTMEGNEVGTLDVTKALNAFSRKSNPALEPGEAEPKEMVARAKKIAEDEAKYQLAQSKTGTEWYTTEMKDHDKVLQDLRPELAEGPTTDSADAPGHPVNLTLFKAAEAILSSGQKPYANVKSALKAWDLYKETGEFPPTNPDTGKSWGPRNVAAYGNAFDAMNKLIADKGEKGAADWLLSEHPVSELKDYGKWVSGKKTDMEPGAKILGEKRGPFMQNLHGIESKFTADMWVSRSWNRWMGTLDLDPRIEDKGKMTSESDVPRNNTERSLMKESFEKTANKLGLTTSSLQAVLWYYEQALYRAHGLPVESWSFSDAAKRVAKEAKAPPEAEQTGFKFGENAKERGGLESLGAQPRPAGGVHALDLLKALGKK